MDIAGNDFLYLLGGEVVVEVEDVGVVLQVAVRGDPHYASAGLHIGLGSKKFSETIFRSCSPGSSGRRGSL